MKWYVRSRARTECAALHFAEFRIRLRGYTPLRGTNYSGTTPVRERWWIERDRRLCHVTIPV